jgi:hypothetical protein
MYNSEELLGPSLPTGSEKIMAAVLEAHPLMYDLHNK